MTTKAFSRLLLLVCFSALTLFALMPNTDVAAADLSQFDSPLPTPPANDNFAQATEISVPFGEFVDGNYATVESNEPNTSCSYFDPISNTVWYKYTPTTDEILLLRPNGNVPLLNIYTGTSLANLSEYGCYWYYYEVGIGVTGGMTYYFQLASTYGNGYSSFFAVDQAPPPSVDFDYYPNPPAKGVDIYFNSYAYDPAGQGIQNWFWNFGDGTTSTDSYPVHRYATDGDYLVTHTVTTWDGRTASIEKSLSVQTHDVGIKRFSRPKSARVGQTKRLIVHVANFGYPEPVQVDLYKSVPGGFEQVGYLRQFVDAKPNGRTTKFYLSYTFTQEDADIGKVVFKAVAYPSNGYDVFPADNEFITFATTVKPRRAGSTAADAVLSAALDDYTDYNTDTISNVNATLAEVGTGTVDGVVEDVAEEESSPEEISESFKTYLPLIQ